MIRKLLPEMRHTEEIAGRSSRDLAAVDDPVAGDEDFLDVDSIDSGGPGKERVAEVRPGKVC